MYKDKKVWAIVLAAGKGSRMGFDKMMCKLDKHTVVYHSVAAFENNEYIDSIIVAAGENIDRVRRQVREFSKVAAVVPGGATRAQSVMNALEKSDTDCLIAIHDGARPFVSRQVIDRAVRAAYTHGAAVPCVKVKDTIKQAEGDFIGFTPDRNNLYITQTPQVFDVNLYRKLAASGFDENITDDAQLFEKAGVKVMITPGDYANYKITTKDDLKKESKMRIGHGYDVHKLTGDRKLILGGVEIPHDMGLLGHSDADVVLHAVMDSLLGALALGDIGKHFPDTDEKYAGADSMQLLRRVSDMIFDAGADVENIDVTILCQKPKLAPHIPLMRQNIADALHTDISRISVKATTEEGLGFTGEELGIACHCVCLLKTPG